METLVVNTESANLTEEQFFQLCIQNKEISFERDKNKNIIIMSPVGFLSSWYEGRLFRMLDQWNEQTNLGYVTGASGGYNLPNGAMRAADVAWIRKERIDKLPENEKMKFPNLCPDFVIELKSKSDSIKTLKEKMAEWMNNGCRLGWLIDFENKRVYVFNPTLDTLAKEGNEPEFSITEFSQKSISGGNVLPGFELDFTQFD